MAQSFGSWLKAQQHRDDPIGDLAQDFLRDIKSTEHGWPSSWSATTLRHRLMFLDASGPVFDALEQAKAEWDASH
jgi:hypothetical protein